MRHLDKYLAQAYRRDVMGQSVAIEMPAPDPTLLAEIEEQLAKIDALRLGANLVNRDFVSYQNRRALLALRDQLRMQQLEEPKQLNPPTITEVFEHGRKPT